MNWRLVEFIGSWPTFELLPKPNLPEIAMVGRSNVGKSTLINSLCGDHKLARVSSTPGKTQEFVFFEIDRKLLLVDLPGYGYARVSKSLKGGWEEIETYLLERVGAVLLLIDSRHGLTPLDEQFLQWLTFHQRPHRVVLTKSDKLTRSQLLQMSQKISQNMTYPVMSVSSKQPPSVELFSKQVEALMSELGRHPKTRTLP